MSRYIEVESLIESLEKVQFDIENSIYVKGFGGATETMLGILRKYPSVDVVEIPKGGIGNLSDGYHTFNELYHHRAILFSVICNSMPDKAWKSKLHDTGDMYDGMFIVGIETPEGQATYHYDIDPYWDMFKVKELDKAPKWDGHTPQVAIDRIAKLSADVVEVRHGSWIVTDADDGMCESYEGFIEFHCSECGSSSGMENGEYDWYYGDPIPWKYCPMCGAKMDGERREE